MKHCTIWIITLSVMLLVGCGGNKETILVLAGGKPVLYPVKGDTVHWVGPDGKTGLPVTFPTGSPCESVSDPTTCKIKLEGYFPYECTGCGDPGLVVGSDNMLKLLGAQQMSTSVIANPQVGAIYCKQNKTTIYPDPLSAPATTADSVSTVQWLPAGGSGITTFTITLQNGTCKEGTTINQAQNVCTLMVGAPATQSYPVTADACSTVGSATLNIH